MSGLAADVTLPQAVVVAATVVDVEPASLRWVFAVEGAVSVELLSAALHPEAAGDEV